jgi:hypothetical protein
LRDYHRSFVLLVFQFLLLHEKKRYNDDIQNRTATTFIQSCWRRLLARKELQRLQKEAKEFSIQLVGDSRMNHLEERGNDTI